MNSVNENNSPATPLTWREFALHSVLMILLLAAAFPNVFLKGQLISSADILFAVSPWKAVAPASFESPRNVLKLDPLAAFRPDYLLTKRELALHQWPMWNPLEHAGVPLLANAQSAVFYPPNLLRAVFDIDTAMSIWVLLKLWLCGATAYLCARTIGLSIGASRLLSAAWMVGSYNLLWASWPLPDVSAWAPVLVLGVELLLAGKHRRGFFALAFGGTLALLAGHPESAFTMSLGVGVYFAVRLMWERRRGAALWRPITLTGAAWGLALAVCMVQILPFVEYILHSYTQVERATGTKEMNEMQISALVAFWVARFFGTVAEGNFWDPGKVNSNLASAQYLGTTIWVGISLAVAALFRKRLDPRNRARVAGLTIAALLGILLAYQFPLVALLNRLPVFNSTQPIYQICFAYFALPLVAAIGFDRWFSKPRSLRELGPVALMLVLASSLVGYMLWWNYAVLSMGRHLDYVLRQVETAAVFAALACVIMVLTCLWYRPRVMWALLTLLLVGDYLYACRGLNPTLPRDWICPETQLTQFFKTQPQPCRVGVAEAFIISGGMGNYGIEEWLGYDGIYPERILRFQNELGYNLWDVMEPVCSIRFYATDPKHEPVFPLNELVAEGALEKVATCDALDVYANHRAMPRAFLVGALQIITNLDDLFDRMLDPDYRPAETAITEVPLAGPLPATPSNNVGEAHVIDYTPNRVQVSVKAQAPAVLVLADAYYPGWKASLDGAPLDLFPVYYAFRGAIIPAGDHTVTYEYDPLSLRIGLWISALALAGSSAYCIRLLARRKPSQ